MTWDELLEYCLAKPGAWQDEPWGDGVVTKVGQKIFAFLGTADAAHRGVGLKCGASREAADEWLIRYPDDASVMPYIGRSGWNNLRAGDAIPDDEIFEAIDASYAMVVSKLPKKDRPASLADVTLRPPRPAPPRPARSARLARPAPPGPAGWRGRRGQPALRR